MSKVLAWTHVWQEEFSKFLGYLVEGFAANVRGISVLLFVKV